MSALQSAGGVFCWVRRAPSSRNRSLWAWLGTIASLSLVEAAARRGETCREQSCGRRYEETTKAYSDASHHGIGGDRNGYMWWVRSESCSARGNGGQYINVVPSRSLVIVQTSLQPRGAFTKDFYKLEGIPGRDGAFFSILPWSGVSGPEAVCQNSLRGRAKRCNLTSGT